MNKDQLQRELKEKVKPGIKPSDLKKAREKNSQTNFNHGILTPPPTPPLKSSQEGILPSPISIKPEQATHRDESPVKNQDQTLIKQLQEAVNYWSQTAQIHLTNLQRTTAELDNAEVEIKELKEMIKKLKQNPSEETGEKDILPKKQTQTPPKEPKQYLFTCDICQQNKKSQLHLARVNGLGINPHKQNKICDYCIRKVDIIKERKEEYDW